MDTSAAASKHAAVYAEHGRLTVVRALAKYGQLTDNELSRQTGWRLNSICKRRLEAQRAGWVKNVYDPMGEPLTRATDTGCRALVWELSPDGKRFFSNLTSKVDI